MSKQLSRKDYTRLLRMTGGSIKKLIADFYIIKSQDKNLINASIINIKTQEEIYPAGTLKLVRKVGNDLLQILTIDKDKDGYNFFLYNEYGELILKMYDVYIIRYIKLADDKRLLLFNNKGKKQVALIYDTIRCKFTDQIINVEKIYIPDLNNKLTIVYSENQVEKAKHFDIIHAY